MFVVVAAVFRRISSDNMGGQNDQIARDVGSEQPVEAEKANDVRGSGSQA